MPAADGPHTLNPNPGRAYRGTRKRLRRITIRNSTPRNFWFLLLLLIAMLVLVPWMLHQSSNH